MPRKVLSVAKGKTKQKQKQSQKVIVNVNTAREKRTYKRSEVTKDSTKPLKPFIPLMPSFNINQPTPQSTDLAKILGMLIPKLQTQSTLGSAIPAAKKLDTEPLQIQSIAGLKNPHESSLLSEALNAKVESNELEVATKPSGESFVASLTEEPEFDTVTTPKESTRKKYDTSKADENKAKLLNQLYNILRLSNTEQNAINITESYKTQSNTKIKEKIKNEKQLAKKI